jgi:hypothetical protein
MSKRPHTSDDDSDNQPIVKHINKNKNKNGNINHNKHHSKKHVKQIRVSRDNLVSEDDMPILSYEGSRDLHASTASLPDDKSNDTYSEESVLSDDDTENSNDANNTDEIIIEPINDEASSDYDPENPTGDYIFKSRHMSSTDEESSDDIPTCLVCDRPALADEKFCGGDICVRNEVDSKKIILHAIKKTIGRIVPEKYKSAFNEVLDCTADQEPKLSTILDLPCDLKTKSKIFEEFLHRQLYTTPLSELSNKHRDALNAKIKLITDNPIDASGGSGVLFSNKFDILADKIRGTRYSPEIKQQLYTELVRSEGYQDASEKQSILVWINTAVSIPTTLKPYPVNGSSDVKELAAFCDKLFADLDAKVYGMKEAKTIIVNTICKLVKGDGRKARVIGLCGPQGIGKTTIAQVIAEGLDRPMLTIKLGGSGDNTKLIGSNRVWLGSSPGQIVKDITICGIINPVIYIDEIDKSTKEASGHHGSVQETLIHATDELHAHSFVDEYLGFGIDISAAMWILTFNNKDKIDPILLDRITVVDLSDYDYADRCIIAVTYIIPKTLAGYGIKNTDLVFTDAAIAHLVDECRESVGMRTLVKNIDMLVGNVNRLLMTGQIVAPVKMTPATVKLLTVLKPGGSNIPAKYMPMYM